jgi:hypothetical protein
VKIEDGIYYTCTNTCYKIIFIEFLCSPEKFKFASKKPKGIHIHQDVEEITMKEHICEKLVNITFK